MELQCVKEGSLLEELDDLSTETWFKGLVENSVAFIMLTRCGIDPTDYHLLRVRQLPACC